MAEFKPEENYLVACGVGKLSGVIIEKSCRLMAKAFEECNQFGEPLHAVIGYKFQKVKIHSRID